MIPCMLLFWFCLFDLLWTLSNCLTVLQQYKLAVSLTVSNDALEMTYTTTLSCDPELTELTRNHRTWCMLLRFKYCTRSQCCCIWLICKTFQRYVSFKLYKGLFYLHDYYNWVRRFVVSDPELPDSLYWKGIKWNISLQQRQHNCVRIFGTLFQWITPIVFLS